MLTHCVPSKAKRSLLTVHQMLLGFLLTSRSVYVVTVESLDKEAMSERKGTLLHVTLSLYSFYKAVCCTQHLEIPSKASGYPSTLEGRKKDDFSLSDIQAFGSILRQSTKPDFSLLFFFLILLEAERWKEQAPFIDLLSRYPQ